MTRDEFIRLFQEEYGEHPDQETLDLHFPNDIRSQWKPQQQQRSHHYYGGSNELLDELRGVVSGIADNARVAIRNREEIAANKPYLSEFSFMALIFLAKAGLYFLLKNSSECGFDLRNI